MQADPGHGCWPDACALMHGVLDAAKNLGIRSAEAMTYVIMLVSSFAGALLTICTYSSGMSLSYALLFSDTSFG